MDSSVSLKDEIWFLRVCHHISNAVYSSALSLTLALDGGVGGQRHAPAALPPGETRYPLYRRLGGPRAGLDRCEKTSSTPEFEPPTVQPVESRYTDWAVPSHNVN